MHKDNLALEHDCDWGVPLLKPPNIVTKQVSNIVEGTYHSIKRSCIQKTKVCYTTYIQTDSRVYRLKPIPLYRLKPIPLYRLKPIPSLSYIYFQVATHVISPLPHTYIRPEDIPSSYDPRSLKGLDMTTVNRNQHIPQCMIIIHIVNNYI